MIELHVILLHKPWVLFNKGQDLFYPMEHRFFFFIIITSLLILP